MPTSMKPAYLFSGDDAAKIADTRSRLRARAERESGEGSLEVFSGEGGRAPDPDAFANAISALSLMAEHRYLLADGIQGWGKAQAGRVAEALKSIPDQTTVVLICHGKVPAGITPAVKKAGGDVKTFEAPKAREMPSRVVAEAKRRGFELEPGAARLLVDRLGTNPLRLANELDRLAIWAEAGGVARVGAEDLEAMIADTSEQAVWSLADAVVEGDERQAQAIAERLIAQGESVTGLTYMLAGRIRTAARAAAELETGKTAKQVADSLPMHPYAAKMLVQKAQDRDPRALDEAVGAIADLEMWCRGGSDYSEDVAFTLALRKAAA